MNATATIIVTLALLLAIAAAWKRSRRRRSWTLRSQFGTDYDVLAHTIGRRDAEDELEERARRVRRLKILTLPPDERDVFRNQWQAIQNLFANEPGQAVLTADELVEDVLRARGYPLGDFERQSDVSMDHPKLVGHYRSAHEVAKWHRRELASTEDLRRAMIYYRALFDQLLEVPVEAEAPTTSAPPSYSAA